MKHILWYSIIAKTTTREGETMKEISLKDTVYQIVTNYPELKGVLIEIGFNPLENDTMLNTVGRMMTLGKGARRAGIRSETIAEAIAPYGYSVKQYRGKKNPQTKTSRAETMKIRQTILKDLILRLHNGESQETVKAEFKENFSDVSAFEISMIERKLMGEGIDAEEIMRLCNIHASLFADSVKPAKNTSQEMKKLGHPIQVLKEENLAIEGALERIERLLDVYLETKEAELKKGLWKQIKLLSSFEYHYQRKENSIFPVMEKYGIAAPPKVMWGVDDEVRHLYKTFQKTVQQDDFASLNDTFNAVKVELEEMIVKEEDIMIPMVQDIFNEDDWLKIAEESDEIGYCLVRPEAKWVPERRSFEEKKEAEKENGDKQTISNEVHFKKGYLTIKELETILDMLPLELTFIDANDIVKYFNDGSERKIFPRTKSAIGRHVLNCHPPKSQGIVEQLLKDFKSGKKQQETLWFHVKNAFIVVNYCAVRDEEGSYMGTLEYVQEIQSIIDLEGEKKNIANETT